MGLNLSLKQNHIWLLLLGSVLTFAVIYFAPVKDYRGDAALTVLTAQAIVEHQTLYVDWYKDAYRTDEAVKNEYYVDFDTTNKIIQRNGHYYHYSIGTGILSLPFVWVANLMGKNMAIPEHEFAVQNFIASLLSSLIFVVIYYIGRCYLNSTTSLIIAIISVLGSSLVSVLGVALWNLNFAVFIYTLALLHLARYDSGKIKAINPFWLGFLLFLAYFARPTAGFFIVAVFFYLFLADKTLFLRVAAISFLALIAFVIFSWFRSGELLPSYYSPLKVMANLYTSSWLEGLYGNLLSPSRGLFVFMPYYVLVLGASIWFFTPLKRHNLFWLCLIWFALHIPAVATRPYWWGGDTYGPRFATDIIPGLILVTVILWREIIQVTTLHRKRILAISYIVLGIFAIFVHSYQGLYNPYTKLWNKHPTVAPKYLLSWKYPQFLSSEESLRQRNLERYQDELAAYTFGNTIIAKGKAIVFTTDAFVGGHAIFYEWYLAELHWRWSRGSSPRIVFKLGTFDANEDYVMELVSTSLKPQTIGVSLNGTPVGQFTLAPFTGTMPEAEMITFNGALLRENSLNEIEFNIPDAPSAGDWDARTEGLAFVSLRIYPAFDGETAYHRGR